MIENLERFAQHLLISSSNRSDMLMGAVFPCIRYGKVFWETHDLLQESQW